MTSKNEAHKGKGGLGKGLNALLGDAKLTPAKDKVQEIRVADIQANRYQPRRDFDEAALAELSDSIKTYGVLQPILVRRLPAGGYELIAGERRLRAAKLAGLTDIPAMVREYSDAEISEVALIENIQREDLNAIEEAKAYGQLMKDFGFTQDMLARKIGRSRSHIANILRLLKLDTTVQEHLANGVLTMGQARPLLMIEDKQLQRQAAEFIESEDLAARQCEALAKKLQEDPEFLNKRGQEQPKEKAEPSVFLQDATDKLTHWLGTQVRIVPGKKKSRIEIEFYSDEDLERILGAIDSQQEANRQQKIEALRKVSLSQNFTV